ncbi:pyridoxal phosphate-dependent aminotransferase [Lachnoclostridium phytofermentans]|uniref:Aminotransferase class I and II n=1 Tax=Lachnoclostridium phytofermentans (strain ATCC 700394 / DSM 18823 / ISDg) TaxID=357809 RepID=A9KMP4_LACP7|nr:histidinol-phosphate transaminase [Lachnoclostridium phytofermentans]ABX41489.1 aminotransferase class I and II [Lachnoclostridium phytofermentans ISDg]
MLLHQANPHGGDVYRHKIRLDYSANLNPFGTPPFVKEAIIKASECLYQYPDPYCEELRQAISLKEEVPMEYIICGNGAAELIYSYAAATKPGKVLIVAPTFCEYEQSLYYQETEVNYYYLNEEKGFMLSEDILDKINREYDTIYLCNPNNPTGKCIPYALFQKILIKSRMLGIKLFVDECFLEWVNGAISLVGECKEYTNLFILKAFTKSYGMAGVRLGYAICSNQELLHRMSEGSQTWNISTCAQLAGIAACKCEEFFQQAKTHIEVERSRIINYFKESNIKGSNIEGSNIKGSIIKVIDGEANFLLLKSDINLYDELLERGIIIRDCSNFNGLSKGYYRIAIKTKEENDLLLEAFAELCN